MNDDSVSVKDISLSEDATPYVDNIQFLDEGGATSKLYYWTGDGWADENGNECSKTIKAGEGILISTLQDEVVISIPSAL